MLTKEHMEIGAKNGLSKDLISQRYDMGWEIERAITQPKRTKQRDVLWAEWQDTALSHGVGRITFTARVQRGIEPKLAATVPPNHFPRIQKDGTVPEWAIEKGKKIGLDRATIAQRILKYKWSIEEACTTPKLPRGWNRLAGKGGKA